MQGVKWGLLICGLVVATCAAASELRNQTVEATLVPSPVEYAVLLPEGYEGAEDLPLVLALHGGNGDRSYLRRIRPIIDGLWEDELIAPMVFVTPTARSRGFYMDLYDKSEQWESFIRGPFLKHLRETYPVSRDPGKTFLTGISMGGMGSLRLAFKYPTEFGAVAALEPGIEPILAWGDMERRHRWWRADTLFHAAFGNPVDEEYWAANNPATMAKRNARAIRDAGIQIYLEAGDEDMFWLYEGTEFLHRILYDNKVPHEYHLVRGADHLGPSVNDRIRESLLFLSRVLEPQSLDPASKAVRQRLAPLKRGLKDHYELDPPE